MATLHRLKAEERALFTPPGSCVHGVLYRVAETELRKLQQSDWGYELTGLEVQTYDGHMVRAWAFKSSPMALLPCEVPPTESYMRQLRDGAADQCLHPEYQAWLSGIDTVSSAGLPPEYWNTPAKHMKLTALLLLGITTAVAASRLLSLF